MVAPSPILLDWEQGLNSGATPGLKKIQALVSGGGISARLSGGAAAVLAGDTSWIIPTHLPILNPERHASMGSQTLGAITMSYQASGGERTGSVIQSLSGR